MRAHVWMQCVLDAAEAMTKYTKELCILDSVIGDGDHGITIERGYRSVSEQVIIEDDASAFCRKHGDVISTNMGGAIGPVYGLLWKALSKAAEGQTEITSALMALAFKLAVSDIADICRVKAGDKTVLDAMIPAAEAFEANKNELLPYAMYKVIQAADIGREMTKEMIAKKGRARFLFDKSRGHYDAGATSFVLWLRELNEGISLEEVR